ncbi:hypothetical protein TSUD_143500 [Trifolium subterraneum]|uniref:Uncharacterized protein n=1 Tax=Trifolium subterraneum TaxID=3900 RepID=A0A2Z6MML7_TRISU|nr:hypothetical protein TSUD_143500 [Trifolium subterraneum]
MVNVFRITTIGGEVTVHKGGVDVNMRAEPKTKERNGTGPEEELRVGEVVVRLGEHKTKVDHKEFPAEYDNQNLGVKALLPAEKEASGTSVYVLNNQVDMFVEKFANGIEEEECVACQKFDVEHTLNQSTSSINKDEPVREVVPN